MERYLKQKILGVDPGTAITGFGVIEKDHRSIKALDFGCIKPPKSLEISKRYLIIFESIDQLIKKHKPDVMAIETQFVYKNAKTALTLGMAKGAAIIAAAKNDLPVFEYAPKKAKLSVVGTGDASKYQVQKMIQLLLNLSKPPTPEDAADALALALCHVHQNNHIKR